MQTLGSDTIALAAVLVVPGRAPVALVVVVMCSFLVWGRWLYAVGGNPDAARRAGIPVRRVLIAVYILSGTAAGIGAVITAGRTNAGSPNFGQLAELDSIAAVIIGGAAFAGGRGHVGNALVGAFTIGVIRNALNLRNVRRLLPADRDRRVILVAVEADVLRRLRRGPVPRRRRGEAAMSAAPAASRSRGATKRFGSVLALDGVDLDLAPRRGAGAARRQRRRQVDADQVHQRRAVARRRRRSSIDGVPVGHRTRRPTPARLGIETVYQDLALFDNLDASDNFYAGRELAGPTLAAARACACCAGARCATRRGSCSIACA